MSETTTATDIAPRPAVRRRRAGVAGLVAFALALALGAALFKPMSRGFERDWLLEREARALMATQAHVRSRVAQPNPLAPPPGADPRPTGEDSLLGARLYRPDGSLETQFGDLPDVFPFFDPTGRQSFRRRVRDGAAMDVFWPVARLGSAHAALARVDISGVEAAKTAYRWRWGIVTIALAALAAALVAWLLIRPAANCRGKAV